MKAAGSLPKWRQWPEQGQTEARSQKFSLGPPNGCRGARTWTMLCRFQKEPGQKWSSRALSRAFCSAGFARAATMLPLGSF